MDIWSKEKRSQVMSRIRGKDTKPELVVRSMLHKHGFRFRIHLRRLHGTPDIVLAKYKTVIFVHGCFWHQHKNCLNSVIPKTDTEKWSQKLNGNVERDRLNNGKLRKEGWKVVTIWECQIERNMEKVAERILHVLRETRT